MTDARTGGVLSPKMLRTYRYLLRPTSEQEQKLDFLLDQARRVYNAALEQRMAAYQETGKGIHYPAQWTTFRDLRRAESDTLGQLNAARNILQLALDTLATPTARTGQAERNVTHRGVRALRSGPL